MAKVELHQTDDEWLVFVGKVLVGVVSQYRNRWDWRCRHPSGGGWMWTDPPIPTREQAISHLLDAHRAFVKSITIPDEVQYE